MVDIWSGDIVLPNNLTIKDIGLAAHKVESAPTIAAASLTFVSTVDTARIPLYLAAGPSLDVWTTSEATEQWFASLLLSKPTVTTEQVPAREWWAQARAQSPIGFLVKLDGGEVKSNGVRITEILFYGTVAANSNVSGTLPTPPSSSPDIPHAQEEQVKLPTLMVYALPLSSDLLYQGALREIPPLSPALNNTENRSDIQPQFLPAQHNSETTPLSPKRKRDLFDEAAQARKKARAAAATRGQESQHIYGHRKSISIDTKTPPFSNSRPASAQGARPPSQPLARSPSISSDTRPLSRKGVLDSQAKRSTLCHVEAVPKQPEEPTTETRNKEVLSRVVMTAMRMHGLQQRKKSRSRRGSVAPGVEQEHLSAKAVAEEAVKDEEYKLIYHQTYKSATLALRKHIASKPLHSQPDRLRDVVEKLLAIFCTDPLAGPLSTDVSTDPLATPGSKGRFGIPGSTQSRNSPFDLPSTVRTKTVTPVVEGIVCTGSPVSRRGKEAAKKDGI